MINESEQKKIDYFRQWYKNGEYKFMSERFMQQSIRDVIIESAESAINNEIMESDVI